MQPAITAVFGRMGRQLGISPIFIIASALQESGWHMSHVYGTNSSSHGKPLNNLFGMTRAGGNNIAYDSLDASADAWIANWGKYLTNKPDTIEKYALALTSDRKHMYNSNPTYPHELAARYAQLVKAVAACGVNFEADNGAH